MRVVSLGRARVPVLSRHVVPDSKRSRFTATRAAATTATIPEQEIIELTKEFAAGSFSDFDFTMVQDKLSEDFIFRGPEIGPLMKDQYLTAVSSFGVAGAFPDFESKSFGHSVDPSDPYRVWFFAQASGTHTNEWNLGGASLPPTGNKIQNGVEACSLIWTPDRKVKYMSVGYCVDRINSNTPNGTMRVAVAGLLRAAGQPGLWDVLRNPFLNWFQTQMNKIQGKPSNRVEWEDLPDWWKELPDSKLRGSENYGK